MTREDPASISPTAHYTAYVWYRHGLSYPGLVTRTGRRLHLALRPMNWFSERLTDRPSLDMMLLARHQLIDHQLRQLIEAGRVSQVLEIAAGFSPRGARFAADYAQRGLVYVEGDLPAQADQKRAALARAGLSREHHHVVPLNALLDEGPGSVQDVCARLFRPDRGLAIITEGLLGYFDQAAVEGMWARFAAALRGFSSGLYLSELTIGQDIEGVRGAQLFRRVLGAFTRGRVHVHYERPEQVEAALHQAGFRTVQILLPHEHLHALSFPGKERRQLLRLLQVEV